MVSRRGNQDVSRAASPRPRPQRCTALGPAPSGLLALDRQNPSRNDVQRLKRHLVHGGVTVLPTETQYALCGNATDGRALALVRQIKGRSAQQPLSVFLPDRDSLGRWRIDVPAWVDELIEAFWPGPLMLILPTRNSVFRKLGGRRGAVGVRVTPEPVITMLCRLLDKPLIATSANPSGFLLSPTEENRWLHEQASMGRLLWARPGRFLRRIPSTILDCTGRRARLVREGAIPDVVWQTVAGRCKEGI